MECCLSTNSQYIGKSAYSMNWTSVRINTHINGMWRADGPPCDKHFQNPGLNFNEHAKFTIIEKINNVSLPRQQRKRFLENREDFWILRFETLSLQKVWTYPYTILKTQLVPFGKAISVPPKPRFRVIYSFIFQIPDIT